MQWVKEMLTSIGNKRQHFIIMTLTLRGASNADFNGQQQMRNWQCCEHFLNSGFFSKPFLFRNSFIFNSVFSFNMWFFCLSRPQTLAACRLLFGDALVANKATSNFVPVTFLHLEIVPTFRSGRIDSYSTATNNNNEQCNNNNNGPLVLGRRIVRNTLVTRFEHETTVTCHLFYMISMQCNQPISIPQATQTMYT